MPRARSSRSNGCHISRLPPAPMMRSSGRPSPVIRTRSRTPSMSTNRSAAAPDGSALTMSGDSLLKPRVAPVEELLRARVACVVVVVPQRREQRVDAAASLAREQVGEVVRRLAAVRMLARDRVRVNDRRRDREQLGADVDETPEDRLLLLELGLPPGHGIERRPRELARRAFDEAQVLGKRPEL